MYEYNLEVLVQRTKLLEHFKYDMPGTFTMAIQNADGMVKETKYL
jgi:hypothetical protein